MPLTGQRPRTCFPAVRESDRFFLNALFRYGAVPASACIDKAFFAAKEQHPARRKAQNGLKWRTRCIGKTKHQKKQHYAGVLYLFRRKKLRRVQPAGTSQRSPSVQRGTSTEQAQPAGKGPGRLFHVGRRGNEGGLSASGEGQSTHAFPVRCSGDRPLAFFVFFQYVENKVQRRPCQERYRPATQGVCGVVHARGMRLC